MKLTCTCSIRRRATWRWTNTKQGKVYLGDARHMDKTPDNSVHCIVTSPPYGIGIDYGDTYDDNVGLPAYIEFIDDWINEAYRVLVHGGRIALNIANTGRKPYVPLTMFYWMALIHAGFKPRGEIIWNKGRAVAAGKCSWGSWGDAVNPQFRDCHEYILVASKGDYRLDCTGFSKSKTLNGRDFALDSFSVWDEKPETCKNPHPAPFPVSIPKRVIEFLTRPGQNILDPFAGSGNTWIACLSLPEPRIFTGYEINPDYIKLAKHRVRNFAGPKLEDFTSNNEQTLEGFV